MIILRFKKMLFFADAYILWNYLHSTSLVIGIMSLSQILFHPIINQNNQLETFENYFLSDE